MDLNTSTPDECRSLTWDEAESLYFGVPPRENLPPNPYPSRKAKGSKAEPEPSASLGDDLCVIPANGYLSIQNQSECTIGSPETPQLSPALSPKTPILSSAKSLTHADLKRLV